MRASLRTSLLFAATAALALASASSAVGAETPKGASSSSSAGAPASTAPAASAEAAAEPTEPASPETKDASSSARATDDGGDEQPAPRHELHGSQVASSEWLPITIGGGVGVVLGVVIGSAVDPSQPVVWGPITGGVLGALSGGAGGAWILRQARGQDTRLAGALTGLGLGGSIGASVYAHVDSTIGKVAALVLFPVAGAVAGHRLAFVLGGRGATERRTGVAITPTAAPLFGEGRGATGLLVGVSGVIF